MGVAASPAASPGRRSALPYVAPFATYVALLAVSSWFPSQAGWLYPARVIAATAALLIFSRREIDLRPTRAAGSVLLGLAVFAIWIAPDALWPAYRDHWLFTNWITGQARSTVPEALRSNVAFLLFRAAGCVLLVPVVEELFWRGWLARWMVEPQDFARLPLGAYSPAAFWAGSALFASEHGAFWEVGLVAGMAYNWWMIRTRSLGDAILTHAVTNGALTVYVLMTGKWQYWL